MTPPRSILIIRLSSLGDILHALPAFGSLRLSFPDTRIGWLVERKAAFLPAAVPGVDRIHVIDTSAPRLSWHSPAPWRAMAAAIASVRAERYEIAIDFQGLIKTSLLGFVSGAGLRIGFDRSHVRERPAHLFYQRRIRPDAGSAHVVDQNLLLARAAGARIHREVPPIECPANARSRVWTQLESLGLGRFVVANPGGGWPTKRWSGARWAGLIDRIERDLGIPAVVTTGPGEARLFEEISRNCSAGRPRHMELPFLELIPLLQRATLFVGGDTGPLHLACALGVPVVGIFGPTSPSRNGPWSSGEESVVHPLPCSFCHGRTCPTQIECMDIDVEEVWEAVRRRLERRGEVRG